MDVCGFILIISLSSDFFPARASDIDEETLCVYNESCLLPCRFTPGSDLEILWIKTKGDLTIHSFHHGQNQDLDQHHKYRGRTSLFEEEMNKGNASLLLRDVTVEDQGRYLCWTNSQKTFVNMKVFAPVSQVHVDSRGGNLICRAHDVYPEPSLKWTMNPEPSAEPQTSVNPSETGLFSVYSSVPLPRTPPYEYTCTVSTEHSTNSTTYERTEPPFVYSPLFWVIVCLVLAVSVAALLCLDKVEKRKGFQVISSRFKEMWKKKTNAPGEASAGGRAGTVDVPNPEEEHLALNNSEEAETEL